MGRGDTVQLSLVMHLSSSFFQNKPVRHICAAYIRTIQKCSLNQERRGKKQVCTLNGLGMGREVQGKVLLSVAVLLEGLIRTPRGHAISLSLLPLPPPSIDVFP